jgi:hypothetical protein
MKKIWLSVMIVLMFFSLGFSARSPEFNKLKNAIQSSVPEGYELNKGQTWDHRHTMKKIAYDWDESQMNTLIYSWKSKSKSFTEMDFLFDHKKITYKGREALFIDGTKTGMSSIKIILNNGAGIFDLTHRSLEGKARNQAALEKMLSKIQLDILEKQ